MGHIDSQSSYFNKLVLIADVRPNVESKPLSARDDLEMSEKNVIDAIQSTFNDLNIEVVHYEGPEELAATGSTHKQDLVLSIYGGKKSRSRMCLVPAVCETLHLPFIGPDAYARAICQDKEVSKNIAKEAGFLLPNHILLRSKADISKLRYRSLPYVLKPSLEGTSIGIRSNNLIRNHDDGKAIAISLLEEFAQPILCEEFIPGKEVSFNFVELQETLFGNFIETRIKQDPNFFDSNLYDVVTKAQGTAIREVVNIDLHDLKGFQKKTLSLLDMIGPLSYGRIDGKFYNSKFYFLEITPDAFLAPWGVFAQGYEIQGIQYKELLKKIITAKRSKLPYLTAND